MNALLLDYCGHVQETENLQAFMDFEFSLN